MIDFGEAPVKEDQQSLHLVRIMCILSSISVSETAHRLWEQDASACGWNESIGPLCRHTHESFGGRLTLLCEDDSVRTQGRRNIFQPSLLVTRTITKSHIMLQ